MKPDVLTLQDDFKCVILTKDNFTDFEQFHKAFKQADKAFDDEEYAFEKPLVRADPTTYTETAKETADWLFAHHGTLYVLFDKTSQYIGHLTMKSSEFKGVGYISAVWIFPEFRKQGYGKLLFTTAQEHATRTRGYTHTMLGVQINNKPALTMYEKMGFKLQSATLLQKH